jgi:hypothetical protein
MMRRIRLVLEEERGGIVLADALAEIMVKEALTNPAKMWNFIQEFINRDEGRTDGKNAVGSESVDDIAAKIREAKRKMEATVPLEEEAEDAEVELVEGDE